MAFTLLPPNEVRDSEGEAVALPNVKVADEAKPCGARVRR